MGMHAVRRTSALLVDGGFAPNEVFFGAAHPAPPDAAIKLTEGSSPKFSLRIDGSATLGCGCGGKQQGVRNHGSSANDTNSTSAVDHGLTFVIKITCTVKRNESRGSRRDGMDNAKVAESVCG